jgi:hypothetical protein
LPRSCTEAWQGARAASRRVLLALSAFAVLALGAHAQDAGAPTTQRAPWPARHRILPDHPPPAADDTALEMEEGAPPLPAHELRRLGLRPRARALTDLSRWPAEPPSPPHVDAERLSWALTELCPPGTATAQLGHIAQHIVAAARTFGVDPLLLGALAYHQSGCDVTARSNWGTGLTMINRGLLPSGLSSGVLAYRVPGEAGRSVSLPFRPPLALASGALLDPATNLYTAAALLRMWEDQCRAIDAPFQSNPHRHHVSHFVWGDRVRGAGPEDGVLIARRRLIQYYGNAPPPAFAEIDAVSLGSPLDGPPRIVTSGLGEARAHGKRSHQGVDFQARYGEPVRAVADGVVTRAGTDLSDGSLLDLSPERAALVRTRHMGARGLFVEITHKGDYRSVYAHLATYVRERGELVKRGDLIGYVGLTGVQQSDPHLHLGLFGPAGVLDPLRVFAPCLFAPELEHRAAHAPHVGLRAAPPARARP